MKTLTYSIRIYKPQAFVFKKLTDKSVYPQWAKAWGDGMTFEGEWQEGGHISFFNDTKGATKIKIEKFVPNESIVTRHIAMLNPENIEIDLTNDMMRKWIGSEESYNFKKTGDSETTLEVVMVADEVFEEMMNAWPKALGYFKEIFEA